MIRILDFLTSLPSRVKNFIYGVGGLLAFFSLFKLYLSKERKEAVKDHEKEKILENVKVKKDAERIGFEEKRNASGLSDSDLSDRLRSRTGDWGSL